jgi:hypothetical protein
VGFVSGVSLRHYCPKVLLVSGHGFSRVDRITNDAGLQPLRLTARDSFRIRPRFLAHALLSYQGFRAIAVPTNIVSYQGGSCLAPRVRIGHAFASHPVFVSGHGFSRADRITNDAGLQPLRCRIKLKSSVRRRMRKFLSFPDEPPSHGIVSNVIPDFLISRTIKNPDLRKSFLPDGRQKTKLVSSSESEATFDKLHGAFYGRLPTNGEQKVKVIRHDDELVQAIFSLCPILVEDSEE